jgi:hypothetical protein
MSRRWTINGDFVAFEPTGVARYAREVTAAIDALVGEQHPLTQDLELTLLAPLDPQALGLKNIAAKLVAEFDRPRIPQLWVQAQLPRHVRGGLVSFGNPAPAPFAVTSSASTTRTATPCREPLPRLPSRPPSVLPISAGAPACHHRLDAVARSPDAHGIATAERIRVTYNGADHALRWSPSDAVWRCPSALRPLLGRGHFTRTRSCSKLAASLAKRGIDVVMAEVPRSVLFPAANTSWLGDQR